MATYKPVKVQDLQTLDVIKVEGKETIVRRVHRINHERARLTTDAGVRVVPLDGVFHVRQ